MSVSLWCICFHKTLLLISPRNETMVIWSEVNTVISAVKVAKWCLGYVDGLSGHVDMKSSAELSRNSKSTRCFLCFFPPLVGGQKFQVGARVRNAALRLIPTAAWHTQRHTQRTSSILFPYSRHELLRSERSVSNVWRKKWLLLNKYWISTLGFARVFYFPVLSVLLVWGVSAVLRPVNQTEHTDGRTDGRDRGAMLLGENQDEEEDEWRWRAENIQRRSGEREREREADGWII